MIFKFFRWIILGLMYVFPFIIISTPLPKGAPAVGSACFAPKDSSAVYLDQSYFVNTGGHFVDFLGEFHF